jgi:hypothetical protein
LLASFSGKHAIAARVARMESQCRLASRLNPATLRQVQSSDVFRFEA